MQLPQDTAPKPKPEVERGVALSIRDLSVPLVCLQLSILFSSPSLPSFLSSSCSWLVCQCSATVNWREHFATLQNKLSVSQLPISVLFAFASRFRCSFDRLNWPQFSILSPKTLEAEDKFHSKICQTIESRLAETCTMRIRGYPKTGSLKMHSSLWRSEKRARDTSHASFLRLFSVVNE